MQLDDGLMSDAQSRYPTLFAWVGHHFRDHPWGSHHFEDLERAALFLRPMETIVSSLERANPVRLPSKQRAFRKATDPSKLLGLRTELLLGHRFAEAGISFEFGGTGDPDFKCSDANSGELLIEVKTRSRDDVSLLHDELIAALAGQSVVVNIQLPRRLAIPQGQHIDIVNRTLKQAALVSDKSNHAVALPEIDGKVSISPS